MLGWLTDYLPQNGLNSINFTDIEVKFGVSED